MAPRSRRSGSAPRDGKEVEWEDLVRGYEVGKGEYVILDPEEIDEAKPESATTIEIGDFVKLTEIDPIYFEKSYFLEPTDVGAKPFTLLKRALEETGRTAVARVVIRTKERLATIRPYDDTLILETMFWPDEIRIDRLAGRARGPRGNGARQGTRHGALAGREPVGPVQARGVP